MTWTNSTPDISMSQTKVRKEDDVDDELGERWVRCPLKKKQRSYKNIDEISFFWTKKVVRRKLFVDKSVHLIALIVCLLFEIDRSYSVPWEKTSFTHWFIRSLLSLVIFLFVRSSLEHEVKMCWKSFSSHSQLQLISIRSKTDVRRISPTRRHFSTSIKVLNSNNISKSNYRRMSKMTEQWLSCREMFNIFWSFDEPNVQVSMWNKSKRDQINESMSNGTKKWSSSKRIRHFNQIEWKSCWRGWKKRENDYVLCLSFHQWSQLVILPSLVTS